MTIDRRLLHAARELREVPIDVPPLGGAVARRQPTRILQALAAPMLFVTGGLFAYGAVQSSTVQPTQSDLVTVPTAVVTPFVPDDAPARAVTAPSVRAELQMIAELVSSNPPSAPAPAAESPPAVPTADTPPASSSSEAVGPI